MRRAVKVYRSDVAIDRAAGLLTFVMIGLFLSCIAAWITHVAWVIRMLAGPDGSTLGRAVLAVCGVFMPPVGVIHGWMIWFGAGFW